MSVLSTPAIKGEINSDITQNTSQLITGTILNAFLINVADSYVNKITGGLVQVGETGYTTEIVITDNKAFVHKKYVDDALASAGSAYSKVSEVTIGGITTGQSVGPTVQEALNLLLTAPYQAPILGALSIGVTQLEIGATLTSPRNFTFAITQGGVKGDFLPNTLAILQGAAVLQSLLPVTSPQNGVAITPVTNLLTTGSQVFTVRATDEKNTVISTSTTIDWSHKVYIGVGIVGNPLDQNDVTHITEAFIKGLTASFRSTHVASVAGNIGAGQRLYYAYPITFGLRKFNTPQGAETTSLVSSNGSIKVRTDSQITAGVVLVDGIAYAVCKNEQSDIGNFTFTLTV